MRKNEDHYSTHDHYFLNEQINLNEISIKNLLIGTEAEEKSLQKRIPVESLPQAYAINPTRTVINQMINSLK